MDEQYWYIFDYFWLLARTHQASIYGFDPDAKGETIPHSVLYGMVKGRPLKISTCIYLLQMRRRWPYELDDPHDAKNRLHKWFTDQLCKFKPERKPLYRSAGSITRDLFIYSLSSRFLCNITADSTEVSADDLHNSRLMAKELRVPLYLNRPTLFCWIMHLRTGKIFWLKWYERCASLHLWLMGEYLPQYVVFLNALMAHTVMSQRVMKHLIPHIHNTNYCCRLMCFDPMAHLLIPFIEGYKPREKFRWSNEGNEVLKKLPPDQPIYLDKMVLDFFYERWKKLKK